MRRPLDHPLSRVTRRDKMVVMSDPSLDAVDKTPLALPPVTDDVLRAVRVMIDAYRLSAESRDVEVVLDGVLDAVARLVAYDAAGIYVLRRSSRRVHHWRWRGDEGPARGRRDPIVKDGMVARAIERGEPLQVAEHAGEGAAPEASARAKRRKPAAAAQHGM